ncbi:peptidyl-prolyl cis-trans isomerase [Paenibacillus sp. 453mf]|uniref:peptidyl-prolyl cis-trans isomerase n=1 Tax=Paenibacillus sp. 453mf TaxID=1761874 RepID=UPI0008E34F0F|nr:peptidyl-prolyl cis-trans isomerase [Paenibacillus sp. 453mf]SFS95097.1 foldase protein PrsA [Paenibacillus sp. 453mf]
MRKQEKGLWVTVVVLTASVVMMGTFILQGMNTASDEADSQMQAQEETVARIAGQDVSEEEWVNLLKARYGKNMLTEMLNRRAVLEEAKENGLSITEAEVEAELEETMEGYTSEEAYYKEMLTQFGLSIEDLKAEATYHILLEKIATAGIEVSEAEVEQYYEEHLDSYTPSRQFDLSMIQVNDAGTAEQVMSRLEQGESFEALAQELSTDEYSKDAKGSLGLIDEDDPFQPEAMMDVARELDIGEAAGPLLIDDAYIIIRLNDINEENAPTREQAMEEIRRMLALNEAGPLSEVEKSLRNKYGAEILVELDKAS